jgi:formylglycine-generating enzyme required for sulfatase activity
MGSPTTEAGRRGEEGPQHEVTLTKGYWLGETPVTQALWVAVMGENPSRFRGERSDELRRPVEQVSWDDCRAFCERLNARIAGLAARLPTEAEWERACRAGTTTAIGAGDLPGEQNALALDDIAWYRSNSRGRTHSVGGRAQSPYGLYDMLGNVWEWCEDDMREYKAAPVTDPFGVDSVGDDRVIRGGSWDDIAREVRAAYRDADSAVRRDDYLGFRLAGCQAPLPG